MLDVDFMRKVKVLHTNDNDDTVTFIDGVGKEITITQEQFSEVFQPSGNMYQYEMKKNVRLKDVIEVLRASGFKIDSNLFSILRKVA